MTRRDAFGGYHPAVLFLYFTVVLVCAMFLMHPVCLLLSLVSATCYAVHLSGWRAMRFQLMLVLPMMVVTALINTLFNHRGTTILAYLPGGNPLTLESTLYGVAAAVMLAAVVTWFHCYHSVMTSDKFIYLFGRIIPSLSMVLTVALRFIPRFTAQLRTVIQAQRGVGRSVTEGKRLTRLRNAVTILSIMLTWSLENAIESADSMKSRGYGLSGRSAFSIYRFDTRDKIALVWLLSCGFYMFCGGLGGAFSWRYFPALKGGEVNATTLSFWGTYFLLCLTPVIVDVYADRAWAAMERRGLRT